MFVSVSRGFFRRLVQIVLVLSVAACGGGGGGGGGAPAGPSLTLSTQTLTFTAANQNSSPPAPQIVTGTMTGSGSGTLYIRIQPSSNPTLVTVSNVVINPQSSSGQASVSAVLPSTLGIGTFTGTITVTACLNDPTCATGQISGSPQVINVTYTIPGLFASPTGLSYAIGNAPADLSKQTTITGVPASNTWTASVNVPWLSILPASGNASAPVPVTASLDSTQLNALNNGTYNGSITITPSSGLAISVPITLTVGRTQVNYVAPYVAYTNTAADVVIRGENFSEITTIQDVTFGGTSASAFPLGPATDTEVRATLPATLTPGTYPVVLQNAQGFTRSIANLVVVDPPSYSATTLNYPPVAFNALDPWGFAYDAERRALIISRRGPGPVADSALLRYKFSGSLWSASPTTVNVPGITSIGLSPDGSQWLAGTEPWFSGLGSAKAGITLVQATDLQVGIATETNIDPGTGVYLETPLVANDGIALSVPNALGGSIGTPIRFTLRNPAFSDPQIGSSFGGGAASADGSRILLGSSFANQIYDYNASTGSTTTASIDFPPVIRTAPSLSRNGSRFILNDGGGAIGNIALVRVFGGLTALGDLPNSTVTAVISPDGQKAYTWDRSGKLRSFDLSGSPPGAGALFPELGIPGGALIPSPGTFSTAVGMAIRMIISPDGGTLFLAGGTQIVVQPVP